MNDKLVSIIVPIYNVEEYLEDCINSLIAQTYKNIEIILIDDGSKDRSGKICDSYSKIDKRIRVIHKKNEGLSSARNKGLEESKGEYISFIDSDDKIDIDFIALLMEHIEKNKVDIA
ncbi:MAG: glycosyltransferase family 2 protein, partial [Clostridia bacterium]|nr:glycosyltransferase family 2 protein [Clostridia bacterium]